MASGGRGVTTRRLQKQSAADQERPTPLPQSSPRNVRRSKRHQRTSDQIENSSSNNRESETQVVQSRSTLPKGQKRNRAAVEHSSVLPLQKRRRLNTSRKRDLEDSPELTEQPRKRRRFLPASADIVDSKVVGELIPSNYSDITNWVESVARETETAQQTEDPLDCQGFDTMQRLLAEKKTVQRKRSSSSITSNSPSEQGGYQDTRYTDKLQAKGGFMKPYRGELSENIKEYNDNLYQRLLETKQPIPRDSLFSDDYFEATMDLIQDRNEAMINETISQLVCPNVEVMAIRNAKFKPFVQSVEEGWNNCKKVTQTRPQPDSAVGFGASAFSAEQLEKLQPWLGDLYAYSNFRATYFMYFPFMTREVKRGSIGLDIADRQNAHSMTVAVRGLVGLFRLFGREQELHGKILAFSLSHEARMARYHGYRAIIDGQNTYCFREDIDAFDFRTHKGRDRWKCLQIYLNILDEGLELLKRIRSGIDDWTPDPSVKTLQRSETSSLNASGLSQQFDDQDLSDDNPEDTGLQQVTPESSATPKQKKKR